MNFKNLREWIFALLEASCVAFALYFLFWPVLIDGHSMEETFCSGDAVAVSRIAAYMGVLDRGDIVLCDLKYKEKEETAIKRLIGLPGDHIKIERNKLYINENLYNEDYISTQTDGRFDIILDDDEYFVMGDNRKISLDSRTTGPIKSDKVIAKVIMRFFPFDELKIYF